MRIWEQFFDEHAPFYEQNPYTKNTRAEVEFMLDLFKLPAGSTILDLGCGTGRHAIALAEKGFRVTGVDLSAGMLAQAKMNAQSKGVRMFAEDEVPNLPGVRFIKADATTFRSDIEFDAVINLCEGGFGLIEKSEDPIAHDLGILRSAYLACRANGWFLLTAMNGYAIIRQMSDEQVQDGRFDPATMLSVYDDEWDLPEGKKIVPIYERLFIPPELIALLRHTGFEVLNVWGGTAGEWGQRPIKLDEVEAMFVCRKS